MGGAEAAQHMRTESHAGVSMSDKQILGYRYSNMASQPLGEPGSFEGQ